MKRTFLYTLFFGSTVAFLLSGNASGPGAVQGLDRTGSPLSPGSCNTSGCHVDGEFAPSLEVELLDNGEAVTEYEPGKTYAFRVTLEAGSGDPAAYGFQAVALSGDGNVQAGTWGDPAGNLQLTEIDGRRYVEHSEPLEANFMEIDWTAPEASAGPVRFYAAGNAVNRDFANSGDGATALEEPLEIAPLVSSIFSVERLPVSLSANPNPVRETVQLQIETTRAATYRLSILDMHGRKMQDRNLQLRRGENQLRLDLRPLDAGLYFMRLTDGRRVASLKVVKL